MRPSPFGKRLADEISRDTGVTRRALLDAFASVPRERFVGPPPWFIAKPAYDGSSGSSYSETSDPASVYANVSVALDRSRHLYNGAPGTIAMWLDALNPQIGERVFHVGCATGYYTAILATLVGAKGSVIGIDVDESLIDYASEALSEFPNVSILRADGTTFAPLEFDTALVNAGLRSFLSFGSLA